MLSLILAASLAATAGDASQTSGAQSPAPASEPAKPAAKSDDPLRVICRRQDKIGTNIQIRTCKTKAEWDKEQQQLDRLMRDAGAAGAQNTGLQVSSGPH